MRSKSKTELRSSRIQAVYFRVFRGQILRRELRDSNDGIPKGATSPEIRQSFAGDVVKAFAVWSQLGPPLSQRDGYASLSVFTDDCLAKDATVETNHIDAIAIDDS